VFAAALGGVGGTVPAMSRCEVVGAGGRDGVFECLVFPRLTQATRTRAWSTFSALALSK
jgi:hypothetical protein